MFQIQYKIRVSFLLVGLIMPLMSQAIDDKKEEIIDLSGQWKFSIGEKDSWRELSFDDNNWESIYVPSAWEEQGFYGYNGFGFYRKVVIIPSNLSKDELYLKLGYIDDVDEVYINGHLVGSSGTFPPDYSTAYNARREYAIPSKYIRFGGKNIIAVKVYDSHSQGGIVNGEIGIYKAKAPLNMDINLQGKWKFKAWDNLSFSKPGYDDSDWAEIQVPGQWENQGYRDYDGYGWYRIKFNVNKTFTDKNIIVLLGQIDDIDQAYLNGELIGQHGDWDGWKPENHYGNMWLENRGYYVASSKLKKGWNTLAVRVYDTGGGGGIHKGPVGIISQSKYIQFWRTRK